MVPVIPMTVVAVPVVAMAVVVVPGPDADEDAPGEVAGPVIAIRSTGIGIVRIVAINAARGRSKVVVIVVAWTNLNPYSNLRGRGCCHEQHRT